MANATSASAIMRYGGGQKMVDLWSWPIHPGVADSNPRPAVSVRVSSSDSVASA
jgi:hypothetical protein